MKKSTVVVIFALICGTMFGCINVRRTESHNSPAPAPKPESESGFNPRLGTELVVHQHFEQFFGCDGKKTSEKKSYVHEGYPDVKLNPKRNIQIDRSSFKNLSLENASSAITLHFADSDGLKKFRVFMAPRRDDQPLGRIFGPPLVEVRAGENRIQYKYESCQKREKSAERPGGPEECVQWFTEEEGEILLTVGVTEKTQRPEICRRYPNCAAGIAVTHKPCEY